MAELPSKQFRKIYPTLTEVTEVTSYGRVLGTWTPASQMHVRQPRIITLPADSTPAQIAAIQAQNSSVPPYDWSDPEPKGYVTPKTTTRMFIETPNASFGHSKPAPKPGKKR